MHAIHIHIPEGLYMDNARLMALCAANRDLRIERNFDGTLRIMSPAGSNSGKRNMSFGSKLWVWNQQHPLGYVFDSSAGFILPNGAMRAADAAWITRGRWDTLTEEEMEGFAPLCPDFVMELRSRTDSLPGLQEKMEEWIENGCRLGWLIDPYEQKAWIYRPGQIAETQGFDQVLSGEDVLPGFNVDAKSL